MLYDLVLNFTLGGPHKTTLDFEILKIEFLMWFFMILFSNIWNLPLYRIMHMWKPKTSIIYETNNSKAKRIEVLNVVIQKRFFAENRVKIVIQWHINAYMGHLWPCSSQGHFFFLGGGSFSALTIFLIVRFSKGWSYGYDSFSTKHFVNVSCDSHHECYLLAF